MAPARNSVSPFAVDEKVFCFHHDMLYEARILQAEQQPDGWKYKIHYKGWKNTWDDWVPQDRVRKFNDENERSPRALHFEAEAQKVKNEVDHLLELRRRDHQTIQRQREQMAQMGRDVRKYKRRAGR